MAVGIERQHALPAGLMSFVARRKVEGRAVEVRADLRQALIDLADIRHFQDEEHVTGAERGQVAAGAGQARLS